MANYQSIPRRFNRVTSSINHAYIDKTLRDKQNTIDTNFGIMQQTVDQTLGQDLIRESDREYLKDKVRGVLNTLDRTDEIKFDSKKARFSIQDALSEAAKDPEVLKQVANTKKIRQIQDFYQGRLKKGDINQQNFQYAYQKAGVNDYLNGVDSKGNAVDGVGDFQYLEYVDVDAKLDEVARKLKAANPNEEVSIQNPLTGETVSKKVSMITPQEMRNYLRVQLNANDLKQLEIDGSMMYGMSDEAAISYRDSLIAENNKNYADDVALLENYRDNGNKTQGEIAQINNQIKALGAEKAFFERNMIGQKTAEAIGGQQLIENKIGLYSQLYTKNGPESVKYDNDYLKRMRDANAAANVAHNQVGNPNISTITVPTNLPEEVNPYQESLNRIDRTLLENSNYLKSQFAALSDDKKKLVTDTMEQIKNDPEVLALYKGQELSNEALQLETINRLGPNFFPPDIAKELRTKISSTQSIQNGIQETTTEFVKAQVLQEDVYEQVFEEETNLTMVTPQGDVNIQQFLKDNGVSNYDTYKSFINGDSKEAKQLRATLSLQSMSLTNDLSTDDVSIIPTGAGIAPVFSAGIGSTNKIDLNESEYRMMRQSVHDLTGESLDETYSVSKDGQDYTLYLKNPETQFAGIVNRTNELYQSGRQQSIVDTVIETFGGDIDRTARNESVIRSKFDDDSYREFASNNLNYLDNTVAGSNSIRIKGNEKKLVDPVYEEILQYSNHSAFDKKLPIDVYRREDGSLFISQTTKERTTDKNGEVVQEQQFSTATIQANDVAKMNVFNDQITLLQKQNTFRTLEDVSGTVNRMNFIGDNDDQLDGLDRLYDKRIPKENEYRVLSTADDSRKYIFNDDVNRYMAFDNPIRLQFEDFVRNTQNYELSLKKGTLTDYKVVIRDKTKDEKNGKVGEIPLDKDKVDINNFEKSFYGTPQVFLSLYSKAQVSKYMRSIIRNR